MINYPFVYPSAKENAPDVFKQMGAAIYPAIDADKPRRPPLGGINLGVSAFSEHKDLTFEAIECLVQPDNQITSATLGGLPPTNEKVYEEKGIEKAYPGFSDLIKESIDNSAPAACDARVHRPVARDPAVAASARRHRPGRRHVEVRRARRKRSNRPSTGGTALDGARRRDQDVSDRTRSERRLGWMLCAPGGGRHAAGHGVSDRLRAGALAPGDRPALPRGGRVRRPRQLLGGPDLQPVVAGRLQHALRDRDLGRDRAHARDDHRAGHVPGDLRPRASSGPRS